jgi:hypothetical protein
MWHVCARARPWRQQFHPPLGGVCVSPTACSALAASRCLHGTLLPRAVDVSDSAGKTQGETDPPELLHLAFQLYDEEENNLLSLDNLIKITEEIGEETPVETLQDMINEAAGVKPGDPDATFITEEQFLKILVKQTETPA